MLSLLTVIFALCALYLAITLVLVWVVQKFPRSPVTDPPDWGRVTDTWVPTVGRGRLETWRIEPDGPSKGIVVFVHGWSRNRDRMMGRARVFGRLGYTCVLFSARDHGKSSRAFVMNGYAFSRDAEAVIRWTGEPVILYGHSAGSAGAIIAASRCPESVRLLILEASYAYTREALLSLYHWVHPAFGKLFAAAIVTVMDWCYRGRLDSFSPARLARTLAMPVLIVHGQTDKRFPMDFARRLHAAFAPGQAELFIAEGKGHSDSSQHPRYFEVVRCFLERRKP